MDNHNIHNNRCTLSVSRLIRQQVLLVPRPPPGGCSVVLLNGVCCRTPGTVGALQRRTVRHGLLHWLARTQPRAAGLVLHRVSFRLLLRPALHLHRSLLHLHPADGARLTSGCPAARVAEEQDQQRACSHCQGQAREMFLWLINSVRSKKKKKTS